MTALLTASLPEYLDEPIRPGRPELRLVQAPSAGVRGSVRRRTTAVGGADARRGPRAVASRSRSGVAAPSWR